MLKLPNPVVSGRFNEEILSTVNSKKKSKFMLAE